MTGIDEPVIGTNLYKATNQKEKSERSGKSPSFPSSSCLGVWCLHGMSVLLPVLSAPVSTLAVWSLVFCLLSAHKLQPLPKAPLVTPALEHFPGQQLLIKLLTELLIELVELVDLIVYSDICDMV